MLRHSAENAVHVRSMDEQQSSRLALLDETMHHIVICVLTLRQLNLHAAICATELLPTHAVTDNKQAVYA